MSNNLPKLMDVPDPRMIVAPGEPLEPRWNLIYQGDDIGLAAALWLEAVAELRRRQLSDKIDASMLRRLIQLRVTIERCQRNVAEHGEVLRSTGKANPSWSILRQALEQAIKIEVECGLARLRPGQRHEIKAPRAPVPSDKYLNPQR